MVTPRDSLPPQSLALSAPDDTMFKRGMKVILRKGFIVNRKVIALSILLPTIVPFSSASDRDFPEREPEVRIERRAAPEALTQVPVFKTWTPGPLHQAQSCEDLKPWLIEAAVQRVLYRYARDGFTSVCDPGPQNVFCGDINDFPKLQNQKPGVETLDVAKADESDVYVVHGESFSVLTHLTPGPMERLRTVALGQGSEYPGAWPLGLLLSDERLVLFSHDDLYPTLWSNDITRIEIFDVQSPQNPAFLRSFELPGYLTDARVIDGRLIFTLSFQFPPTAILGRLNEGNLELPTLAAYPSDEELIATVEEARALLTPHITGIVEEYEVEELFPFAFEPVGGLGSETADPLMTCMDVLISDGPPSFSMLAVVSFDLTTEQIYDASLTAIGVLGNEWALTFDAESLVIGRSNLEWFYWDFPPPPEMTEVHRFGIDASAEVAIQYSASAVIGGRLPVPRICENKLPEPLWFADFNPLDISGDFIRVATYNPKFDLTPYKRWDLDALSSSFSILWDNGVGQLGRVGYLEFPAAGDRFDHVQFSNDLAFITGDAFSPIVLDFSATTSPRDIGSLEMYWSHPFLLSAGNNYVWGVARGDWTANPPEGLKLHLFDASTSPDPLPLHEHTLPRGEATSWHSTLYERQAFSTQGEILAFPSWSSNESGSFRSVSVAEFDPASGIQRYGEVDHTLFDPASFCSGGPIIRRSVLLDDVLLTISNLGIKASALENPLRTMDSVPFPSPGILQTTESRDEASPKPAALTERISESATEHVSIFKHFQ